MIDGVLISPLKIFKDKRGMVLHFLNKEAPSFKKFGEVYFSVVNPGIVKGWKFHKKIHQNFAVPVGKIKLVIFDPRENSTSRGEVQEIEMGLDDYKRVSIPPGVWYSFKGVSVVPAMITNVIDYPHEPEESMTRDLNTDEIPYRWK